MAIDLVYRCFPLKEVCFVLNIACSLRFDINPNDFGLYKERLFDLALKACQYEYLVDGTDSIWCKFFPQSLLRLIEYREDLKYYCKYGYKYNISRDMTCDLVSDLVNSLKDLKSQ